MTAAQTEKGSLLVSLFRFMRCRPTTVFEAPGLVSWFHDLAAVRQQSRSAVVSFASPRTYGHSPKIGLALTMIAFAEPTNQMEQELPSELRERRILDIIEDDEVEASTRTYGLDS